MTALPEPPPTAVEAIKSNPHVLYRFFDANDRLLYVGITHNPSRRFEKHRARDWWRDVATIRLQVYPTRAAVQAAERRAVANEHPRHNIRLRDDYPRGESVGVPAEDGERRDRLATAESGPLSRHTLVGSFCHANTGRFEGGRQGCVVAEPAPSVYLVEWFSFMTGASTGQGLVRIDEMTDWSFYDSAGWMQNAYEHGVSQRWERQRAEGEASA